MYIMIAGPYKGNSSHPKDWEKNHTLLNLAAYEVFKKGHIPIIGVNAALPIIKAVGNDKFDELMMPISLACAERCDAVLRIGGNSTGADKEVAVFKRQNKPVYLAIEEIP